MNKNNQVVNKHNLTDHKQQLDLKSFSCSLNKMCVLCGDKLTCCVRS